MRNLMDCGRKARRRIVPVFNRNRVIAKAIAPIAFLMSFLLMLLASVAVSPADPAPRAQTKQWAAQMPEGEGKKIIVEQCELCHTLERVVTTHRGKDDWQAVIDLMVEQGATLSDQQAKTVVDYLAANYGPKS
ncbi:MAG: hypothetical protein ACRD3S_00170, partial [Terracidiphilus sp.]